jgi:hypothetical protein
LQQRRRKIGARLETRERAVEMDVGRVQELHPRTMRAAAHRRKARPFTPRPRGAITRRWQPA